MNPVTVDKIEVYVVEAPLEKVFWMATEAYSTAAELFVILRSNGIVGYGQAHGNPLEDMVDIVANELAPIVLKSDGWTTTTTWDRMLGTTNHRRDEAVSGQPHFGQRRRFQAMAAIAALDIALWDLRAKAAGLPLFRLLGADKRTIPAYASGGYYPSGDGTDLGIERLLDEVESYVELGFSRVKVKAGRSVSGDIERISAIRRAFPDISILVDANGGWDFASAKQAAILMQEFDLGWIEEPLQWHYTLEHLRQVGSATSIPIASGEQEPHRWACVELIERGGIRWLQFDCTRGGGITDWLESASFAALKGIGLAPHHDAQIHGHLLAKFGDADITCETFPDPIRDPLWSEFYEVKPEVRAGQVELRDEPGLGIEPSSDALARWGRKVWES